MKHLVITPRQASCALRLVHSCHFLHGTTVDLARTGSQTLWTARRHLHVRASSFRYAPQPFLPQTCPSKFPSASLLAPDFGAMRSLICWQHCFGAANHALAAIGHSSRKARGAGPFLLPQPLPNHAAAAVTGVCSPFLRRIFAFFAYCMCAILVHGGVLLM